MRDQGPVGARDVATGDGLFPKYRDLRDFTRPVEAANGGFVSAFEEFLQQTDSGGRFARRLDEQPVQLVFGQRPRGAALNAPIDPFERPDRHAGPNNRAVKLGLELPKFRATMERFRGLARAVRS